MEKVYKEVETAQELFKNRMTWLLKQGGITPDVYVRILSMEYHLTNGVQRHFLIAASHPDMSKRRGLRKFLCDFANEEELHYLIALKDMENMGREPYSCPLEVKLWKAYFDSVVMERPFLRLGGTCVLENIAAKAREVTSNLLKSATFLNEKNTRFVVIHQHGEDIPHGEQVLEALQEAKLEEKHVNDLIEGARTATILFLRMMDWCILGDELKPVSDRFKP